MPQTIDSDTIESELARMREVELTRDEVNAIIGSLGEIIGIDDLAMDEQGVVELVVDEDVELSLIYLPNLPGIVSAAAMPEGAEQNREVLTKLLQTNMSWALTQGGSFVYVPPRVALCRLVPLTPGDSERLDRELATFVELAKAWQNEINTYLADIEAGFVDADAFDAEEEPAGMKI